VSEPQHHWALDCPYYRGVGTCGQEAPCSAHLEPLCQTEEPMTGWKRRDERGRFVKREASNG
jgi:hypothetical protein